MKSIFALLPFLLPLPALAGAGLLGPLTDTIPPLPPPPPELPEISQADIVSSETHDLGDRKIIVQEVNATALPALPDLPIPPPQPPRPALPPEVVKARLAEARAKQRERQRKTPQLSAVVYHSKAFAGQVRTLFSLNKLPAEDASVGEPPSILASEFIHENQPLYEGSSIYFWSTIDANLLSLLPQWQANDGTVYESLQLSVNNIDLDQRAAAYSSRGRVYQSPSIPTFTVGNENYLIMDGEPVPEESAAIRDIHELYAAEYAKLTVAYNARERALRERAEYLKANPSKLKDSVIRYRLREENISNEIRVDATSKQP